MDMFVLAAVAILAAMAGFWAGRSVQWQLAEAGETGAEDHAATITQPDGNQRATVGNRNGLMGQAAAEYAGQTADAYVGQMPDGSHGDVWTGQTAGAYAGGNVNPYAGVYGRRSEAEYDGVYPAAYDRRDAETDTWRNRRGFARLGERSYGKAAGKKNARFDRRKQVKTVSLGREIGSPVAGQMGVYVEDGRRKLRLLPDQGKVYAPASGRIQRLYPMGCAMLLHTEFGADLLMQVGSGVDEMCSGFYHCRVMEHEYVRKGTLLLEYDPAGIRGEGASPEVILSVENEEDLGGVTVTGQNRIKVGETILYIACGRHSESYEKLS